MQKRIVIKLGTNVLTKSDGDLDKLIFRQVVVQVVKLIHQGYRPILVSSGAVGAGKRIMGPNAITDEAIKRQVYSAVGQTSLMKRYFELFIEYEIICAQILATKEDFAEGEHYQNMLNCFEGLLQQGIVPIVNENDVVSLTELMFTDNDELAGLTARMIGAEKLIILSVVDGLLNGDGKPVAEVGLTDEGVRAFIADQQSSGGRGGMHSKYETAKRCAQAGIETIILNGKKDNILLDSLNGDPVGTRFLTV